MNQTKQHTASVNLYHTTFVMPIIPLSLPLIFLNRLEIKLFHNFPLFPSFPIIPIILKIPKKPLKKNRRKPAFRRR